MLLRGKTLILRQRLRRRKTNQDNNYRVFTYAHLPQLLPFARGFYCNTILPAHNGRGRQNEIPFCRPRFLCFSLGTLFVIPTCYSAENQSFALTHALCGLQILFCPPALRKPAPQAAISSSQIRRKAKSRRDKNSPIFVRRPRNRRPFCKIGNISVVFIPQTARFPGKENPAFPARGNPFFSMRKTCLLSADASPNKTGRPRQNSEMRTARHKTNPPLRLQR